jgi:hypothetical protein
MLEYLFVLMFPSRLFLFYFFICIELWPITGQHRLDNAREGQGTNTQLTKGQLLRMAGKEKRLCLLVRPI